MIAVAPTVVTTKPVSALFAGALRTTPKLTKVGHVMVNKGDNTVEPNGGSFTVWYDRGTHTLHMDPTT